MANSLQLSDAEIDAVRGLQSGTNQIAPDDPVWSALRDVGLVQRKGTGIPVWSLTMRGRLYRTGVGLAYSSSRCTRSGVNAGRQIATYSHSSRVE